MKAVLMTALAALALSPAVASAEPESNNVYHKVDERTVDGVRQIKAIRADGKKAADVRVEKTGEITGTVDGRPVRVKLQEN